MNDVGAIASVFTPQAALEMAMPANQVKAAVNPTEPVKKIKQINEAQTNGNQSGASLLTGVTEDTFTPKKTLLGG